MNFDIEVLAEAVLRRLDTVPVEIGNKSEMAKAHYRGLHAHVVSIPVSSLVPLEDMTNALHDVFQSMKLYEAFGIED